MSTDDWDSDSDSTSPLRNTTNCLICNDEIVKVAGNFVKLTPSSFQGLTSLLQLPPLPRGLGRGALRHGLVLLCVPCGHQVKAFQEMLTRLTQLKKEMDEIQMSVTQTIIRNTDAHVHTDSHVRTARNIICYNMTASREAKTLGVNCTASPPSRLLVEDEERDPDPVEDPLEFADTTVSNIVRTKKCSVLLKKLELFKRSKPRSQKNIRSKSEDEDEGCDTLELQKGKGTLRRFHCSECGFLAKDMKGLRCHQAMHSKVNSCKICNKAFGCKARLKDHLKWHSGKEPFLCRFPRCSASFLYKSDYDRHVRTHTGEKPLSCSQCEATFTRKSSLKRHLREVHYKTARYACTECGKSFPTKTEMVSHEKVKDTEEAVRIECIWCYKLFSRRSCLREHETKVHHICVKSKDVPINPEIII